MRINVSELIEEVTALRIRAAEIPMRMRRDGDLLTDVHHELSAALSVARTFVRKRGPASLSASSSSLLSTAEAGSPIHHRPGC